MKVASDQNFQQEVLQSPIPALVDFWAVWCGPCRAVAPVLDEIASEYEGKINVLKLNVDENPGTAAQYGVRSIPTLILFKNGRVVDQSVGVAPKEHLTAMINKALG